LKQAWIIKRSRSDTDNTARTLGIFTSSYERTALGAEPAPMLAAPSALGEMVLQLAARDSKSVCRDYHGRRKAAARHVLAITTMAFEHHDWFGTAFVTNRAARAAAGKWNLHFGRSHQSGISASTSFVSKMSDSCQPR
jgi:hypothetical protein